MLTIQDIAYYLQQNTRNKIVFCREGIDGIRFINVGLELSRILGENPDTMDGADTAYKQVLGQSQENGLIGMYLALENIGILFEPDLRLDVRSILDAYSKNQCLIVKTNAEIADDRFYFLRKGDGTEVDLQGLSYQLFE
jgi:hypothetical protein